MAWRKPLLGLGAGIAVGYAAACAVETIRDWRAPRNGIRGGAVAYARVRRSLEVADMVRGMMTLAALAYGPLADSADRATLRAPVWLRPALYVAPLSVAMAAFDLPVAFVQDYALERRFGLSDQTRAAWLAEYAKSTAIAAAMMAFVATLFGCAVRRTPRAWPALASLGALPLLILAHLIIPLYIMPLFNKFEPLTGSLEVRLRALAARFGVGDAEILRIDMSRQTKKANAFVTGIGKTHRIVIGDTLIEAFPAEETEFVVAHELGHYVNKDMWRSIALGECVASALFVVANAATPAAERNALRDRPLLLVRLYATMLLAMQLLRPLLLGFSRSREWAADRFALAATHDPQAGASAFRRLRDQNLADEDPPSWYEFFFSSHPSLKARIAALERAR